MSLDETGLSDAGSDRFIPAQPESRPPAQTPSWGAKRCPSCHTPVLHNQVVCAECGTQLAPRLTKLRCHRCGNRATSDHVICPHCGRELRAAPSRLLTIGAPALLVGALAIALIARDMPSLLQGNDNLPLIRNFVITPVSSDSEPTVRPARQSLAPAVVQSGAGQSTESTSSSEAPAAAVPSTPTPTPPPEESNGAANGSQTQISPQDTVVPPTETPAAAAVPPTVAPTETATAAAETSTPTSTPLPPPTATTIPTATSTPAWKTYAIVRGDTIGEIAKRFNIDLDELMRANGLSELDVRRLQIGDEIVLPGWLQETATPTAAPAATATETPTPGPTPAG